MSVENEPRPTSSIFSDEEKPVIDNQIAAYKAVVPSALISVALGVLSALSFTDLWFTLLGVGGVLAGVLAQRKIKKFPDAWTGQKWAERGIAISLLFTLGALSISYTQWMIRVSTTKAFAREIEQAILTKSVDDIVAYQANPDTRVGKSSKEVIADLRKAEMDPRMFDGKLKPVVELKDLLAVKGQTFAFEEFEAIEAEEFRIFAWARYKTSGPGNKLVPPGDNYVLIRFNGRNSKGKFLWIVDEFIFPYEKKSKVTRW